MKRAFAISTHRGYHGSLSPLPLPVFGIVTMMRTLRFALEAVGLFASCAFFSAGPGPVVLAAQPAVPAGAHAQPDPTDTRLLTMPAVSAKNIAFIYAEDLWVADLDGKNPRRLTTDLGLESNPVFSPDGKTIAFSAQYDGNTDVYTIPVTGGPPRRLTAHPGPDVVRGWTPDGKAVLFSSPRYVFT